jgi:hypothetical protein
MSRVSEQRERINWLLRERFAAAEAFGCHLAPDDPSLADDLWLHWETPAPFAAKYPDWFLKRWHLDIHSPDLDWYNQDVNPWSHQDCLGVRGLVAIVPRDAAPTQIMAALDASRVVLPDPSRRWAWVAPEVLALAGEAFLAEASRHIQVITDRVLVQLRDFWSSDYVLTTAHGDDLPTLKALALRADTYEEGLRVLGA